MAIYEYAGIDKTGKSVKGAKEADSVRALRISLKAQGVFVTKIKESNDVNSSGSSRINLQSEVNFKKFFERVNVETLALATRQLATLLQSGVPMLESLKALIEQVDNQTLKRVLSQVRADVNEGFSLADAMAKHKCFSSVYVNMVRAGESSGALELVLERLADFTEGQSKLQSKVMGALTYPIVMMVVAILVVIILMTTVVPKITAMFASAKVQLPLMTRALIATSSIISSYWWLLLIVVVALAYGLMKLVKTPKGRAYWDRAKLKMPIFGSIMQMVSIARFSRTLSTLLSGGVPLLNTLQIVRNVVSNDALEKAIDSVREAVREGEDIAGPLRRSGQFPPMVTHMIAVGEKSGQLETMLSRVATAYEARVETRVSMLTSLLEPLMILFMGVTIGGIVGAVMVPIMQMSSLVK
ncbi:MAG: type II secretion system inner membrane protein GspF [Myxococcales bacterium]|nr:type II secretion system inner membrane protein GspF [Myxococcales bacterium]USN49883.1 MAG: type II secretion system inner membrane protein GspF [Myxococcales bacterium]